MSTKMKGLLKGLRFISHIFEEQGEKELQIGFPTDVKHVAHIGWDGPTANAPSWIGQYKGEGESSGATAPNADQQNGPRVRDPCLSAQEKWVSTGSDSLLESPSSRRRSDSKLKGSRKQSQAVSSLESPRRSSTTELDSPPRDSSSSSKGKKKMPKGTSKSSSKSKHVDQTVNGLIYSDPGSGSGSKTTKNKDKSQSSVHAM